MMYKTVDLLIEKATPIPLHFILNTGPVILNTGPVAPKFVSLSYNPKISRFSEACFFNPVNSFL